MAGGLADLQQPHPVAGASSPLGLGGSSGGFLPQVSTHPCWVSPSSHSACQSRGQLGACEFGDLLICPLLQGGAESTAPKYTISLPLKCREGKLPLRRAATGLSPQNPGSRTEVGRAGPLQFVEGAPPAPPSVWRNQVKPPWGALSLS